MKATLFNRSRAFTRTFHHVGFSLVEVVLALGIFCFVLIAMMGLLTTGLQNSNESEEQIQAANLASLILATRRATPTTEIAGFPLSVADLANGYNTADGGSAKKSVLVGNNGLVTSSASTAVYQLTYQAGTNKITGSKFSQIYLMLSWPPSMSTLSGNVRYYECLTQIPLP